ncbi:MAG: Uncharacterised protein [Synechococcus sp. MIT S9220]|nr:MAG: Uncharacterised protein [Synechococcus sp. MIT S9220]
MLHAVLVDLFSDHAGALGCRQQGHEWCLQIGWETWERLGGDVNAFDGARGDDDAIAIELQNATTVAQFLKHGVEVIRNNWGNAQR